MLVIASSNGSICTQNHTVLCPSCPQGANVRRHNTDTISLLALDKDHPFSVNAKKVVELAKNFSTGVVLNNLDFLHTTIEYLCCFTDAEYETIVDIIRNEVPFPGYEVSFDGLHCSQGYGLPNVANIRAQYDAPSQKVVGAYVAAIEDAMLSKGLNVTRRRADMVPFHVSIVEVDTSFPIMDFLEVANAKISWEGVRVDLRQYAMVDPPHLFAAQ